MLLLLFRFIMDLYLNINEDKYMLCMPSIVQRILDEIRKRY